MLYEVNKVSVTSRWRNLTFPQYNQLSDYILVTLHLLCTFKKWMGVQLLTHWKSWLIISKNQNDLHFVNNFKNISN